MRTKDPLSYKVIGCAMEVYNTLGPGLLESAYEKASNESLMDINQEATVL